MKNKYSRILITISIIVLMMFVFGCEEDSNNSVTPSDKGTMKFMNKTTTYTINWIEINSEGNLLKEDEVVASNESWSVHVDPGEYSYFVTGIGENDAVAIWDNDGELVTVEKGKTVVIQLNE